MNFRGVGRRDSEISGGDHGYLKHHSARFATYRTICLPKAARGPFSKGAFDPQCNDRSISCVGRLIILDICKCRMRSDLTAKYVNMPDMYLQRSRHVCQGKTRIIARLRLSVTVLATEAARKHLRLHV